MTGEIGGFERMMVPTLDEEKKLFSEAIIGQDDAVASFANLLASLRSGIRSQKPGPFDALFLAGPSGVGKTEITFTLAKLLGNAAAAEKKVMVINGGEYQKDHYIARLFGSPPGYVGSKGTENEVPPVLSRENLRSHQIRFKDNKGTARAVTIILIDEAEKAHDAVHMAFLSILDKGRLEMADSSVTNFTDTVIIFTSNLGNKEIEKLLKDKNPANLDDVAKKDLVTQAIGDKYPPELRGRIGKFIIFNHLTGEAVLRIANKQVLDTEKMFQDNRIKVSLKVSSEALIYLSRAGYSSSEGARAMGKVVKEKIYEPLVLINNELSLNGRRVFIDVEDEKLIFYHDTTTTKALTPEKSKTVQKQKRSKIAITGTNENIEPVADSIIDKITKDITYPNLFSGELDLEFVCDQINDCVKAGIADREQIVSHPLLKMRVNNFLAEILRQDYESEETNDYGNVVAKYIVNHYGTTFKIARKAGIFENQSEAGMSPEVLGMAQKLLKKELKGDGVGGFNQVKGKFVRLGIGDNEYWNREFREVATKAFLTKGA